MGKTAGELEELETTPDEPPRSHSTPKEIAGKDPEAEFEKGQLRRAEQEGGVAEIEEKAQDRREGAGWWGQVSEKGPHGVHT